MVKFHVHGMDSTGMDVSERIEAETHDEAAAQMRRLGYFVTKIAPERNEITLKDIQPALKYTAIQFAWFFAGLAVGLLIALKIFR